MAQDSRSAAIDAFCIEARGGEELLYAQAQIGFSTVNLRVKLRECEDFASGTDITNPRGKGHAQAIYKRARFYSGLLMQAERGKLEIDELLFKGDEI
jgi:hypothetical protein